MQVWILYNKNNDLVMNSSAILMQAIPGFFCDARPWKLIRHFYGLVDKLFDNGDIDC